MGREGMRRTDETMGIEMSCQLKCSRDSEEGMGREERTRRETSELTFDSSSSSWMSSSPCIPTNQGITVPSAA